MRNVSSAFMRALAEDKRDWICTATITLVQNIYSYPKVKKDMRYRISGTYTSVSLDGVAITVSNGYFTAPDDGVLTITGGTSSGDTPTVIRQILDIDNSHIWENGFKIEDAVSSDNLFEIGGAIINQATLVLNNIYDEFTEYDFFGANVVMRVGLEVGETVEYIKMGTFLVDEAKYNSSLLTLTCLDYMTLFDTPSHYNGGTYLGTPSAFLQVACEKCGVTLATPNFPNKDTEVYATLSGNTSYRQVVSWVAQIAGCYARMNVDGELELNFYDFDALEGITEDGLDGGVFDEGSPYASGDSADGGSFNPWDTGDVYDGGSFTNMPNVHIISSDYSHNMSMDDIVITGVKVIEKVGDFAFQYASPYHNNQSYAVGNWCRYNNNLYECISAVTAGTEFDESKWKQLSVIEHTCGSEGYMVVIDGNEIAHGKISGALVGQTVANLLGIALIGRTFRQASISHPSDPTIEAGDVALFIDRKGYQYPIVVSSTTFSNGDAQNTTSSAQTPQKNSSQKYSASTKNYVAMREQLSGETAFIENTINDKIANAGGLYETYTTNVKTGEGMIWHLHDKQNLAESNIVMMFSDVGFTLTSNYQDTTPTWYGMTVDGTFIANTIQTINMFFDYAHGGTLKLGGTNNTYGRLTLVNANDVAFGHMGYTGPYTNQYGLTVGKYQANVYNYYVNVNSDGAIYYGKDKLPVDSIGRAVGARIRYAATPQTDSADIASWRADEADSLLVECDSTIIKSLSGGSADGRRAGVQVTPYYVNLNGWVYLNGTMLVSNGKGRLVKDTAYGDRTLYCYETPTPYFGDIGTAKTDENGEAFVSIDDIFDETVNTNVEYSVFLQKEGQGDIWVDEKDHSYFIVKGTPNLKFSWEVKAVQKGFELFRLDDDALRRGGNVPSDSLEKLLDDELDEYDRELEELYE